MPKSNAQGGKVTYGATLSYVDASVRSGPQNLTYLENLCQSPT